MTYYCCEEHVEYAIDIIVDELMIAPLVEKLQNLSTGCEFCKNNAIYIVTNGCTHTKC